MGRARGRTYVETFDDGPGGWFGWVGKSATPLEISDGAVISRSPWWVDYNHAPPGAGYLHLIMCLSTSAESQRRLGAETSGPSRFIEGRYGTDFRGARMTLRLKGELDARGAELVLLAQGRVGSVYVNYVLAGQPFQVRRDWTTQTIELAPREAEWRCLGSRRDREGFYGSAPSDAVLSDVSEDIILVLFPLDVAPAGRIEGDMHRLRAGEDYAVNQGRLPEGYIAVDTAEIAFPTQEGKANEDSRGEG